MKIELIIRGTVGIEAAEKLLIDLSHAIRLHSRRCQTQAEDTFTTSVFLPSGVQLRLDTDE